MRANSALRTDTVRSHCRMTCSREDGDTSASSGCSWCEGAAPAYSAGARVPLRTSPRNGSFRLRAACLLGRITADRRRRRRRKMRSEGSLSAVSAPAFYNVRPILDLVTLRWGGRGATCMCSGPFMFNRRQNLLFRRTFRGGTMHGQMGDLREHPSSETEPLRVSATRVPRARCRQPRQRRASQSGL